jgi:DNA-binding transcriptional ArsR family regulator
MAEEVKRLPPKTKTLRELYLKSGNQCAFPECHSLMVDDEGVFIGQVCHIEAAEEGGERFNGKQTNEDRRAFSNLMLMCYENHQVTNDIKKYTVSVLKDMKASHEKKYGDIASKMRNSIADHTEESEIYFPERLDCINEILKWSLNREELDECLAEFTDCAQVIKNIPIPTRELLVIILKRSDYVGGVTSNFGIAISEIKHACDMDITTLQEHLNILDKHGIIMEGDPYDFNGQSGVVFRTLPSGWPIYEDLKGFASKTQVTLTELLVDLRFNLLD